MSYSNDILTSQQSTCHNKPHNTAETNRKYVTENKNKSISETHYDDQTEN